MFKLIPVEPVPDSLGLCFCQFGHANILREPSSQRTHIVQMRTSSPPTRGERDAFAGVWWRIRGPFRGSPTGRGVRGEGELVGEADQLLGLQFGERCSELVFGVGTVVAAAEERDQDLELVGIHRACLEGAGRPQPLRCGGRGCGCTDAPPGRTRWGVSHAKHRPANRLSAKGRS